MANIFKFFVSIVLSLAIISVVALGYEYSTLGYTPECGASDNVKEPHSLLSNMTEGWGWNVMDGLGYNNAAVITHPDILIMGSSQMEAAQLPRSQNVASVLADKLGGRSVYNVGVSGHFFDICMSHLDSACSYFNPRYVVMEASTLFPDEDQMTAVIEGTRPSPTYRAHALVPFRYLYDYIVPATGVLIGNFGKWRDKNSIADENADGMPHYSAAYYETRTAFLRYAAQTAENHCAHLIILWNPLQYHLSDTGTLVFDSDIADFQKFQADCEALGITAVTTQQQIQTMYACDHVLPNGFANSSLGAGHLNTYGHEAMAQVLCNTISELETP